MINLSARNLAAIGEVTLQSPEVLRVTTNVDMLPILRQKNIFLGDELESLHSVAGFGGYLIRGGLGKGAEDFPNSFSLPVSLGYLAEGDILRLDARARTIRVLFRTKASINALLLTERCNSFCVMCSQPPRDVDDSYRIDELHKAIALMPISTRELMFSGGEPTLLGNSFVELLMCARDNLPRTALHVLSNGRNFQDEGLAIDVARVRHPDLMFGIPLYSDVSDIHDYVVQAKGAFDETLKGILNLKKAGQKVEIRVVVHRDTYERLPQLAEFISRNLLFADQVALMGLELMGFGKTNSRHLWMDPLDYGAELDAAIKILHDSGIRVLVFNHQLCTLSPEARRYAVNSISDWKREYVAECNSCTAQERCGGFFSSVVTHRSRGIGPI